ncbi:unnamed protein product [Caenorhabditis angaria]|uniref:Uncharacterized protein n=1 Tax=Caenorhabditis angaria TaxID=860376 RepID=A0A9P1IYU9_9PELO|nr:unnamed protein product [Caenorhabditis angaria]
MSSSSSSSSSSSTHGYEHFPRNSEYDKFFHTKRLLLENQEYLRPEYVQKSIEMMKEADEYIEKGVMRLRGENSTHDYFREYFLLPSKTNQNINNNNSTNEKCKK